MHSILFLKNIWLKIVSNIFPSISCRVFAFIFEYKANYYLFFIDCVKYISTLFFTYGYLTVLTSLVEKLVFYARKCLELLLIVQIGVILFSFIDFSFLYARSILSWLLKFYNRPQTRTGCIFQRCSFSMLCYVV